MTATWRDNNQPPPWPRKRWTVDWVTKRGHRTGRSRSFWTHRGANKFAATLRSQGQLVRVERLH
jgi:hypothetical protein